MKRNISELLLSALLMVCCTVMADAANGVYIEGIYYSLNAENSTAVVTWGGSASMSGTEEYENSITVPDSIHYDDRTYKIVGIDDFAFCECASLTSVSIPVGVKTIGGCAFTNCLGLTAVTFADGSTLESIGENAFSGCESLISIYIPKGVNRIGRQAFTGCSSMNSITVAENNRTYDSRNGCNAIIRKSGKVLIAGCRNTVIPDDIAGIEEYAFYDCSGLASISIPEGVASIGGYAFWGCSGATSISIPSTVTAIEKCAFTNCSGLASISVADGNLSYDSRKDCNAIIRKSDGHLVVGCRNTVVPDGVAGLEEYAFYGCSGLSSIDIPGSVTVIKNLVFAECSGLASITIPASVIVIGQKAFYNCTSLASLKFAEGSKLERIEWYAFYGCSALVDVTLPASINYIAEHVFDSCKGLISATFDEGTGESCLTSIGEAAFMCCSNLASVTLLSSTPPSFGQDAWFGIKSGATLTVPCGASENYKDSWSEFFTIEEVKPRFSLAVSNVGWASLYYDKDLDIPDGARVFYASAVEDNVVTLTEIRDHIPAETAVIVNAEEGTVAFTYAEETVGKIGGTNFFKGSLAVAAIAEIQAKEGGMTIYTLCGKDVDGNPVFRKFSGETLAAYRMYLPLASSDHDVKFRIAGDFDLANGISTGSWHKSSDKALSLGGLEVNEKSYLGPFLKEGKLFMNIKK